MHVCLSQLIMSIGIVLVDLQSVQVLDCGFTVLALGAIPLSALQIFLLPYIWIAVTPGQQSDRDKEHDYPKRSSPIHHSPPAIETQLNCLERIVHCFPSLLAAFRTTTASNPLQNGVVFPNSNTPASSGITRRSMGTSCAVNTSARALAAAVSS